MQLPEMRGDLVPAGRASVEVIVGEKKGSGVGSVGVALKLGLRGPEPPRMIKPEKGPDRDEVIRLTNLVPAYRPPEVVANEAFQITKQIPSVPLVADREVFRHTL